MFYFEKNAMGTRVAITVYSANSFDEVECCAKKAFEVIEKLEEEFSLFRESSDICEINRRAGESCLVSQLMLDVVNYAIKLAEETEGALNPLVGKLTSIGGREEKLMTLAFRDIIIDTKNNRITIPEGSALDLNCIVKGLAIDEAFECFEKEENVMIEAGGDFRMKGRPEGKEFWEIGIRNPEDSTKIITVLKMKDGAICTSGKYFREDLAKYQNRQHLVDVRGGLKDEIGSMTVIANTAKEADALSTASYFMKMEQAAPFVESFEGASCLMVDGKNEVWASQRMKEYFNVK